MEEWGREEKTGIVVAKIDGKQAKQAELSWRMLENNKIKGILPFDYYYVDDRVCFRYAAFGMQSVEKCFAEKKAGAAQLMLLCGRVLEIIQRGTEYLLETDGYCLEAEWIFCNLQKKEVALCYLPGKAGGLQEEYTTFVEYLMQRTDHADKKAVAFIYAFYDFLQEEEFVIENLLLYLRDFAKEEAADSGKKEAAHSPETEKKQPEPKNPAVCRNAQSAFYLRRVDDKKYLTARENDAIWIPKKEAVAGRGSDCAVFIPFGGVSRRHALLAVEEQAVMVTDLGSKNGTWINRKQISANAGEKCAEGDVLTFADSSFRLCKG